MPIVKTDPFSQVPLFTKMRHGPTELALGTSFLYRRHGRLYLLSNWHNFAGRDPATKEPLSAHAGVPDTVSCYFCLNGQYIQREWQDIPLNSGGEPDWYQHPKLGSDVDIGALPIELSDKYKPIVINEMPYTKMVLRVSHDVFVLGYPLGLVNSHGLPVWKRATVASEPGVSDPFFFVDTATRAGMSGSPVIHRYRGFYKNDPEAQEARPDDWLGEADDFVGIYSGRLGASQLEAQLGIVWKPNLIDEVIDGARKAEC